MSIEGRLVGFGGMLHGLFRMRVTCLVILFSVVHRGGSMRMRRLFVEFCCALMGIVGHDNPFFDTPITASQPQKSYVLARRILCRFVSARFYEQTHPDTWMHV